VVFIKYAKCIRESQIVNSKEEFLEKSGQENAIYCLNEVTKSKYNNLYCVPLNFIYDCLKYGDYVAIIDIEDSQDYVDAGSYIKFQKISSEQRIVKLIHAYSKECIDYVFKEVGNSNLIHSGYIHWLPEDLQKYFYMLMEKYR